ncbi:DMT family transporter [Caldimonas sp. KR1-144]|uniref:DMT family transporter n=1 Tax=Caldimonas sp. KR1-144 TaxID=3400911 RepID=UPI003C0057FF
MKPRDLCELLLLAALWGASFLFMRLGAGEFGPVALAAVRVGLASLALLPLALAAGQGTALRQHWRAIAVVGISNSALPFLAYSFAALSITAGLASVFNATTPLWGALIAWLWLRDRLTPWRVVGLVIGFAGVLWLAWDKASFKPGAQQTGWAVLACLGATLLYGWSASFTKRRLTGVPPLAVATGSQCAAAVALLPLALLAWPAQPISSTAWIAAVLLALLSTALAYLLYFRLIAHVGPANAIAVTFLIPVFAVLWGGIFLHEAVSTVMLAGCAVILLGTSLATGFWSPSSRTANAPSTAR